MNIKQAITPRASLKSLEQRQAICLAALHGGGLLMGYVEPYSTKEDFGKLLSRRQEAINHFEPYLEYCIKSYIDGIYREGLIHRTIDGLNAKSGLGKFLENGYEKFIESDVRTYACTLDEFYVYVSTPEVADESATAADGIEQIPELSIMFPNVVQNLSKKANGELEWITIRRETKYIDDRGRAKITKEFEIVTETQRIFVNEKGDIVNTFDHTYGRVPVVRFAFSEIHLHGNDIHGCGPFIHVAYKSIAILQFLAMFIEAVVLHLYYKITMGKSTAKEVIASGMGNAQIIPIIPEPGGIVIKPEYMATPNVELDKLIEIIYEREPQAIMRIAGLSDTVDTKGGGKESGIAKIIRAVPQMNRQRQLAKFLQQGEQQLLELVAIAADIEPEKATVSYPKSFDNRPIAETLQDWTSLVTSMTTANIPQSITFNRESVKNIVRGFWPDMDAKTLKIIDAEIDSWQPEQVAVVADVAKGVTAPDPESVTDQEDINLDKELSTQLSEILPRLPSKPKEVAV